MIPTAYRSNSFSRTTTRAAFPLLLVLAASFVSCSGNYRRLSFNAAEKRAYIDQLESSRERKDAFFRSDVSSPLTKEQRTEFRHLNYYPPNLDLIFAVKLIKEKSPEKVGIQATGGETRPAIRYGWFEFKIDGKKLRLYAYKMTGDNSGELFIPFTDETNGEGSYSGGRYIDLEEKSSGEYTLDFNYAYSPYCACNHNYSCPIVPSENHLDVRVGAGEMKY